MVARLTSWRNPFHLAGRKQLYESLIFGHPEETRAYPDVFCRLEPGIAGYYREISDGRLTWTRAGFVGPPQADIKNNPLRITRSRATSAPACP